MPLKKAALRLFLNAASNPVAPTVKNGPSVRMIHFLVGATGFEPTTFWSRTKRATKLRYAPKKRG